MSNYTRKFKRSNASNVLMQPTSFVFKKLIANNPRYNAWFGMHPNGCEVVYDTAQKFAQVRFFSHYTPDGGYDIQGFAIRNYTKELDPIPTEKEEFMEYLDLLPDVALKGNFKCKDGELIMYRSENYNLYDEMRKLADNE